MAVQREGGDLKALSVDPGTVKVCEAPAREPVSPRLGRQVIRCVSVMPLCLVLFGFLCMLLGMGAVNHAVLESEVVGFSVGQDVGLVLGQVVLRGGVDVQVSVETLSGELRGRPAEPTVLKTSGPLSKKAAAKASINGRGEVGWSADDYHDNQLLLARGADFRSSDRDGDGSISLPEFRLVCRRVSVSVARAGGAEEIFHLFDKDKNGALDISEFLDGIWWAIESSDAAR